MKAMNSPLFIWDLYYIIIIVVFVIIIVIIVITVSNIHIIRAQQEI